MLKMIFLVITGILLTGCMVPVPVDEKPEPTPSQSQSEPSAPETAETFGDEDYADVIRQEAPSLSGLDTATLIENAELVCISFDTGATFEDIGMIFLDSGFTPQEAGVLIGGAVAYKCPEHENVLDSGTSL